MNFSDKLSFVMQAKGLTGYQLAINMELQRERIRAYLNGSRNPKPDMIIKFAETLCISSFLLDDSNFGYLRLETVGDMLSFIMELIKKGLITVTGKKDNLGKIKSKNFTMHFSNQIAKYFLHNSNGAHPVWDTTLYSKETPYHGLRFKDSKLEQWLIDWYYLWESECYDEASERQLKCALELSESLDK